ncbi:MAG: hypothetical protein GSR85_08620 [Desulfurococcales archaeon]|nr:hypothetical protein [Desulfurococcales archaeon]
MANSYLSMLKKLYYPLSIVRLSLQYRDIRRIFAASLFAFSIIYAIASGMIFKSPISLPTNSLIEVNLATGWPLGVYPWLTVVLGGSLVFSINLTAMLFLISLSILFASNIALFIYIRRYTSDCCNYNSKTTVASTVPAIFSTFACCGGGLTLALFSYLFSLGIGSAYAAIIVSKGWILALISLLLLYWNLYRVSGLIRRHIPRHTGLRLTLYKK